MTYSWKEISAHSEVLKQSEEKKLSYIYDGQARDEEQLNRSHFSKPEHG